MTCSYCGEATTGGTNCAGCGRDVMVLGAMSPWKEFHRRIFALMEHRHPDTPGYLCIQTDTWDHTKLWEGPTHTIRCRVWWQAGSGNLQENLLQEYLDIGAVGPEWATATAMYLLEVHYAYGGLGVVTKESKTPAPARWVVVAK